MRNNYIGEILITVIVVSILGMLLLPTKLLMPMSVDMMLVLALIISFFIFSAFFWKERAGDEREHLHRLSAGRISFLIGAGILVTGIVLQSLSHDIDPWLVYALIGMIVAKLLSRMYSNLKQ